jgi:heat shock protein HslJ
VRGGRISAAEDITGEWELAEGTADGAALPSSGATLQLGNGEAGGVSFCNQYFGTYRLTGAAIVFEGLGGTEMACEPDVMVAERAYLYALGTVDTAAVGADDLVLSGDDVRLRFTPVAPVPDSPLESTRWMLETLVQGEAASSTLGEPALLLLTPTAVRRRPPAAGRSPAPGWSRTACSSSTSCSPTAASARPTSRPRTRSSPGSWAPAPQVAIAENRLTLTVDDGRGLVYRAGP